MGVCRAFGKVHFTYLKLTRFYQNGDSICSVSVACVAESYVSQSLGCSSEKIKYICNVSIILFLKSKPPKHTVKYTSDLHLMNNKINWCFAEQETWLNTWVITQLNSFFTSGVGFSCCIVARFFLGLMFLMVRMVSAFLADTEYTERESSDPQFCISHLWQRHSRI